MAFSHKRLFLIPLDSRPVCYDMPRRLAAMAGLELHLPAPNLLGRLKKPANFKTLTRWVKNHLFENDPVIVALDTVAYGGLISSRINGDSLNTLRERVDGFFRHIRADACFGFSSILRIPNYDLADEEPDYWARHGRALYRYSAALHETGATADEGIPPDVLADFRTRRAKNHALNEHYLGMLETGRLDYLTYCQDDTGPYGLNVQEAGQLAEGIRERRLDASAHVQTGADEVAACMLARWMALQQAKPPVVYPVYTAEAGRRLIARFDGLPVEAIVEKAIAACGARVTRQSAEADLWLLVHAPAERQGDYCAGESARLADNQAEDALNVVERSLTLGRPLALADVVYANGGDVRLVEGLLTRFDDLTGLYGYAGWNTPGNTIGTAVAMGIIRWLAEAQGTFRMAEFCRLMLIRLADDWLYQADIRQLIRQAAPEASPDETRLNVLMADGLFLLKNRLGLEKDAVHCRYPCGRTFEVEIGIR
jgi:hypothetical protein